MTTDNDNNGNGKKQATMPPPGVNLFTLIAELQQGIETLQADVQLLHNDQGEHADKFAAMFQIGMVGISEAINNQVRNAIDRTDGFAAEHLHRLSVIATAINQPPNQSVFTSITDLTEAVRDVATAIHAAARR